MELIIKNEYDKFDELANKNLKNKNFLKEFETFIKTNPYALYHCAASLSYFKSHDKDFLTMRKKGFNSADVQQTMVYNRHFAEQSIVGVFKALEILDYKIQKLPTSTKETKDDDIEQWKEYFYSVGKYISEIDIENYSYDKSMNISQFLISVPEVPLTNRVSASFKEYAFLSGLNIKFELLINCFFKIINKFSFIKDFSTAIISYKEIHEIFTKELNISNDIFKSLLFDVDNISMESHRPDLQEQNIVMKPIIKVGDFVFISIGLFKFSKESYFQIYETFSFPFGIDINKDVLSSISEQYSQLHSSNFLELINEISIECGFKVEREVQNKQWNTNSDDDLGDIDIIIYNPELKIVLINEVKYKKKNFYNLVGKLKTEKKWIKRQNQRKEALIEFVKTKFGGEYQAFVNIITVDPMSIDHNNHYFNNITIRVLKILLEEFTERKSTELKPLILDE